ncbi:hypothetical protein MASR1M12_38750 [Erysipelotrichia bacterium]
MALAMIIQVPGAGLLLGMQKGWPLWTIGAGLLAVAHGWRSPRSDSSFLKHGQSGAK